ncbi:MAG: futalosine hydrolase, partial [Vulcanimicrobiaceae bacterium]
MDRASSHDAPVLVVCAVARELAGLRARDGVDVVAVGVGPVEAALGTARALASRRYRAAINAGIAGGFRDRCTVGDVVVCTREDYVELGLEDGSAFPLPDGAALERTVEADPGLIAPFVGGIAPVILGRGVTSATVTSTDARAQLLAVRYRADVESMEGFAVLRAARDAGVPAIEIRGVSNVVGDRAT